MIWLRLVLHCFFLVLTSCACLFYGFKQTLKGVSVKFSQASSSFINGPPQTQTLDPPLTRYTTFKRQMVGFVVGKSDTVSYSRRFLVKQI